jgi:GTP cyclohydrolase I
MYVEELLAGRFCSPPTITEFDSAETFDDLIVTGPIEVRSTCAHHLMPIYGTAIIAVVPSSDGRLIGLSKYDRVVHHFAKRFQVQEELVNQIGKYLVEATAPRGLAVRIRAVHMCKTHRGVLASHNSHMISSAYFGDMKTDQRLKAEFLQECQGLERSTQS